MVNLIHYPRFRYRPRPKAAHRPRDRHNQPVPRCNPLRVQQLFMLRAVNFEVPACTAAQNSHSQNQQKRPGITFCWGSGSGSSAGSVTGAGSGAVPAHSVILTAQTSQSVWMAPGAHFLCRSRPEVLRQRPPVPPADRLHPPCSKVGVILFAVLVHRLVIVNDNVKVLPPLVSTVMNCLLVAAS